MQWQKSDHNSQARYNDKEAHQMLDNSDKKSGQKLDAMTKIWSEVRYNDKKSDQKLRTRSAHSLSTAAFVLTSSSGVMESGLRSFFSDAVTNCWFPSWSMQQGSVIYIRVVLQFIVKNSKHFSSSLRASQPLLFTGNVNGLYKITFNSRKAWEDYQIQCQDRSYVYSLGDLRA